MKASWNYLFFANATCIRAGSSLELTSSSSSYSVLFPCPFGSLFSVFVWNILPWLSNIMMHKLVILNFSEKLILLWACSYALETLKSCTGKKEVTGNLVVICFRGSISCNKESKRNVCYSNENILPKYARKFG